MHAIRSFTSLLRRVLSFVHATRLRSLLDAVQAVVREAPLALTALGRRLPGKSATKHKIKKAGRLLANGKLQVQIPAVQTAIARELVEGVARPVFLVDWTDVGSCRYALVATLLASGRSLPVFFEVHESCGDPEVERSLLARMHAAFVGLDVRPVLITDAGFRGPWCRAVAALGWDYISRLSDVAHVEVDGKWTKLGPVAASVRRRVDLSTRVVEGDPIRGRVIIQAPKIKGRKATKRPSRKGVHQGSESAKKAKHRNSSPLALFTSLTRRSAADVVDLYRTRMSIEESFRDLKSHRFGSSLEDARARSSGPLRVLLLIGSLALLAHYVTGLVGELLGLHRQLQANTVRKRRVLSRVFLGREIIRGNLDDDRFDMEYYLPWVQVGAWT